MFTHCRLHCDGQEVDLPCSVTDSPWSGFGLASVLLAVILPVVLGPLATALLHGLLSLAFSANQLSVAGLVERREERRNVCCNVLLTLIFLATYVTSMVVRQCPRLSCYHVRLVVDVESSIIFLINLS